MSELSYLEFLERKRHSVQNSGIEPIFMPNGMVIDRIVELYSNTGEVVLTPFMGVGSEVFSPVSMGRKAIGIELKASYYNQAIKNLKYVKSRFVNNQATIFK